MTSEIVAVNQPVVEMAQGELVDSLIEQWIKDADVQPVTGKSYRTAARKFVGYLVDNSLTLSRNTLKSYRQWLVNVKDSDAVKSLASAKTYFVLARKFTAWLAHEHFIDEDYGAGLKGVKLPNDEHSREPVTADEVAKLINLFPSDGKILERRNRAIIALLAVLGLRTVEVTRLCRKDYKKENGVWVLKVWGKGCSGATQTVVLPAEIKREIDNYLELRGRVKPDDFLFTSESRRNRGQGLSTKTISALVKDALAKIEIEDSAVVAHSLRHTFVTLALDADCTLEDVQKAARHRDSRTTEIYRHDQKKYRNPVTRTVAAVIYGALDALVREKKTAVAG